MSALWRSPEVWPPGTKVGKSRTFVRLGDDLRGKYCPVPILDAELQLMDRPGASKVLPVHPLGAERWFQFAKTACKSLLAEVEMSDEEVKLLARLVWAKCRQFYRPGQPVRTVFEAVLTSAPEPLDALGDESEDVLLEQKITYLAILGAAIGLVEWLESGESDTRD